MQRTLPTILAFALIALYGGRPAHGGLVFNVVDDFAGQNGYHIDGTIVTSGVGLLSNVLESYDITITGPYGTFVDSGTLGPAFTGDATVTSTSISVSDELTIYNAGFTVGMEWGPFLPSYSASSYLGELWYSTGYPGPQFGPWTIATSSATSLVPEPTSLVMTAMATVCGIVIGWTRSGRVRSV